MEREAWDLIDITGRSLGITIDKGAPHPQGTYHLVTGIWVVAPDGRALITKRSEQESQYPGLWENTGGCARAGEDGIVCVLRELEEETGISASRDELLFLGTLVEKTALVQIYGLSIKKIPDSLALQEEEVMDAKWVSRLEWEKMIAEDKVSQAAIRRMRAVEKALDNMGWRFYPHIL